MKKFVLQVVIFAGIYLILCISIYAVVPYHWGNVWVSSKISYLEDNNSYNTLFFGSSQVYRQIDPSIIDRELNHLNPDLKIKSFNVGAPATFNPQSYFLAESFIDSEIGRHAKYLIIELNDKLMTNPELRNQERTTYYFSFSEYIYLARCLFYDQYLSKKTALKEVSKNSLSVIKHYTHYGHFGQILLNDQYYNEEYLGELRNGYYPLEDQLSNESDEEVISNLRSNNRLIKDNPEKVTRWKDRVTDYYEKKDNKANAIVLKRLEELLSQAQKNNIQVFFLVSPRLITPSTIGLMDEIDPNLILNLSHPRDYPDFYDIQYSFDEAHLDSAGSQIYSCEVAYKLSDRLDHLSFGPL